MTWLKLLREKLPDSVYAVHLDAVPLRCPRALFGRKAPGMNSRCMMGSMLDLSCRDCWNSEVPEDERRK